MTHAEGSWDQGLRAGQARPCRRQRRGLGALVGPMANAAASGAAATTDGTRGDPANHVLPDGHAYSSFRHRDAPREGSPAVAHAMKAPKQWGQGSGAQDGALRRAPSGARGGACWSRIAGSARRWKKLITLPQHEASNPIKNPCLKTSTHRYMPGILQIKLSLAGTQQCLYAS